jgi:Glycosyl hydrolases family 28
MPSYATIPLRCLVTLSILFARPLIAENAPYPTPGTPSTRFEVQLDGVPVPVVAYKDVHYCHFRLENAAAIKIVAKDGIVEKARLQPASRGLTADVEGASVRFTMPRPMSVVAQLDFREKLFLFADRPPDAVPDNAINALTLGAIGDGRTDNTVALQKAINDLPPGGALVIPAGHFRSGTLHLRSKMRLHLEAGALLQALDDHEKITPIPGATSYIGFLIGSDLHDVAITGQGTIDGNGYVVRKAYEAALKIKKQPGRLLYLRDSRNISIREVTLRDSYSWNVQFLRSDEIDVSGIKILSDVRLSNHDGIDVVGCSHVAVSDSFIFCEDDGITPKAAENREISEDHTYRNLVIWAHKANGIRIGSESACRVMRDFHFENIDILNGANGIRLDTTEGAIYEDMTFRNIHIEDLLQHYDDRYERNMERRMIEDRSFALVLYVDRTKESRPLGGIRRLTFEGLHWANGDIRARLDMRDALMQKLRDEKTPPPISDITFRACSVAGKAALTLEDLGIRANDMVLSQGVKVEP